MSLITDLPAILTSSQKLARRAFSPSVDLKEQNVPLVGTYCTFMPQEIAMAAGAVVSRCAQPPMKPSRKRKKDLPRNLLCPLIKAATASAKPINVPTSISLTWWLGKPPATAKRKCMSTWPEFKAVHVMQLPNSASDAASRALWKTEILRLQQVIEARFGTPISERGAARSHRVEKSRAPGAGPLYRLGQLNPPALSGGDILKVVYGATFRFGDKPP